MKKYLLAAGLAAAALAIVTPETDAQGPVRRGLRRTGEIAVGGTQRVVQGAAQGTRAVVGGAVQGTRTVVGGAANATGAVIGGAANAGRAVVGGTVDATRSVVGGTARGIAAGVDAITPNIPLQARAGATLNAGDQGRDARWRFAQHNGDWWYYTPENSWMYQRDGQWNQFAQDSFQPNAQFSGQVAAGYRGVEGQDQGQYDQGQYDQGQYDQGQYDQSGANGQNAQHAELRHDGYGRAYICENGRAVYIEEGQQSQADVSGEGQYQNQPTPAPEIPSEAGVSTQPAAATGAAAGVTTGGTTAGAEAGASAGLSGEAPREVLQSSGQGTLGTVEPGQTAQ